LENRQLRYESKYGAKAVDSKERRLSVVQSDKRSRAEQAKAPSAGKFEISKTFIIPLVALLLASSTMA
jgi:hypothetical protein